MDYFGLFILFMWFVLGMWTGIYLYEWELTYRKKDKPDQYPMPSELPSWTQNTYVRVRSKTSDKKEKPKSKRNINSSKKGKGKKGSKRS